MTGERRHQQHSAAEIVRALKGEGDMCFCPAHHDTGRPNLHVQDLEGGTTVVKCFRGCSQPAVIAALHARGIYPRSARTKFTVKQWRYEQRQREKDKAEERSAKLRIVIEVLRTAQKKQPDNAREQLRTYFAYRGLDQVPPNARLLPATAVRSLSNKYPQLGWQHFAHFDVMVVPVVHAEGRLLGLHATFLTVRGNNASEDGKSLRRTFGAIKGGYAQVAGVLDPDKWLATGEGIENVLSGARLIDAAGIAALSAPFLEGLVVPPCKGLIIFADYDESGVGLKAAENLAGRYAALGGIAWSVLPPEGCKDWNEAFRKYKSAADRAELRRSIMDTKPAAAQHEVRALTMAEVLALDVSPRVYLLEPWLEVGSLAMLHAPRGHGKTRFLLSAAYAIATGQRFILWEVQHAARVLFVDGELPTRLLQARLQVLGNETENLRVLSRDIMLTDGVTLPDLGTPEGRTFLDRIIERENSEVIILDSLSTLIRSGVENEAESWAPVQDWLLHHRLRGRTVVLIHHEGRNKIARGTSKREDVLDTIVRLEERQDDDLVKERGIEFVLTFTKAREFGGEDRTPLVLSLSTASGTAEWSYRKERDLKKERIIALSKQPGMTHKKIAAEMKLTEGRISQIVSEHKKRESKAAAGLVTHPHERAK